jgi:hypothetical protein
VVGFLRRRVYGRDGGTDGRESEGGGAAVSGEERVTSCFSVGNVVEGMRRGWATGPPQEFMPRGDGKGFGDGRRT